MNAPLAMLLRCNRWATATLLEACRDLSQEHLDARVPGASGTVGELLTHIVGGEQTFVLRTKGRQHEGELSRRSDWPGIDELLRIAAATGGELITIAESHDADTDVDLPYMRKVYRFPRSFFLVHAVEHGVEHRTEVKVALGALGLSTPDLDGWSFAAAMGFGAEI